MRFRRSITAGVATLAMLTGIAGPAAAAIQPAKTVDEVAQAAASTSPDGPAIASDVKTRIGQDKKASLELAPGMDVSVTPNNAAKSVSRSRPDGVQVMTVLDKGQSSATFDVSLPADMTLTKNGQGYKIQADGPEGAVELARIKAPWAVDAKGKRLPTDFTLQGNRLIQTVDTSKASYPITVDPYVVRTWYGVQVRFTLNETRGMAASAGFVNYMSYWIPQPYGAIVYGVSGAVVLWAGTALAYNKCVALNVTYWGGVYPWYWSC